MSNRSNRPDITQFGSNFECSSRIDGSASIFQGNVAGDVNISFSEIPGFAWKVFKSCKGSSDDDFKAISRDVSATYVVLREIDECASNLTMKPDRATSLRGLATGCMTVLRSIEALKTRYDELPVQSQLTWARMRRGQEEIRDLRQQLILSTTQLSTFVASLNNSSVALVETLLNKFLAEVRDGTLDGSVASSQSLSPNDKKAWRQLRKQLEKVGLTVAVIQEHQDFIVAWFQDAFEKGILEEDIRIDEPHSLVANEPDSDWDNDPPYHWSHIPNPSWTSVTGLASTIGSLSADDIRASITVSIFIADLQAITKYSTSVAPEASTRVSTFVADLQALTGGPPSFATDAYLQSSTRVSTFAADLQTLTTVSPFFDDLQASTRGFLSLRAHTWLPAFTRVKTFVFALEISKGHFNSWYISERSVLK